MNPITPFKFTHTPDILFGQGKLNTIPGIVHTFQAKKVLFVLGGSSFKKSSRYDWLMAEMSRMEVQCFTVRVEKEPSVELIDENALKYRNEGINLVISIGGGSVIDAGKAISAMLTQTESVMAFLEGAGQGKVHDGRKVPFVAVPTTSGTGSEATKNAVLSRIGENGFKNSLRHDHFVPDVAVVDPELILGCPPEVSAASGMDAFCQLLESFMSNQSNPMTDALALSGLQYAAGSLPDICTTEPDNIEKRSHMAYAALLSGITLANAGLGVVHGYASSIGGLFDIPHGVICGTMLPQAIRVSIQEAMKSKNEHAAAIRKYVTLARLLCGTVHGSDEKACFQLAEYLEEMKEKLKLPGLGRYGVTAGDAERIATKTSNKNNPVQLNHELLTQIVVDCL